MRGFTMLLVVYGHIPIGYQVSFDSFSALFHLLRMPLFFMISGYLFYRPGRFARGWSDFRILLWKKFKVQIVPTVIFILLFAWIFQANLVEILLDNTKDGYWFTIALFWFFCFFSVAQWGYERVIRSDNLKYRKLIGRGLYAVMLLYAMSLTFRSLRPYVSDDVINGLSLQQLYFFPFFCVGAWGKCHVDKVAKLLDNKWFMAVAIMALTVVSIAYFESEWLRISFPYDFVACFIIGVFGGGLIVAFFRRYRASFTLNTRLGYWLQYLGQRTLDVYLLHYFFLPRHLKPIGHFFAENFNPTLEFFFSMAIAMVVVSLCLIVSNAFRLSPCLASLLFGKKIK